MHACILNSAGLREVGLDLPEDPPFLYELHLNLLKHGQQVCQWSRPKCGVCVLRERCDAFALFGDKVPSFSETKTKGKGTVTRKRTRASSTPTAPGRSTSTTIGLFDRPTFWAYRSLTSDRLARARTGSNTRATSRMTIRAPDT